MTRVIFPVELCQSPPKLPRDLQTERIRVSIPTASAAPLVLELRTDSLHLARFFEANWVPLDDHAVTESNVVITALKNEARCYGLLDTLNGSNWFCPESRQVWTFGTEFYGNLKNVVRGLCAEIAPFEEMFLHGCALAVDGQGVVLAGRSGVGKTTLTAALRQKLGAAVKIVNEDWGPLSLTTGRVRFTRQPHLHKKYSTVHRIAPHIAISPDTYPSENFDGDFDDPQAHLLISPSALFGKDNLQDEATLQLYVVVVRDTTKPAGVRRLFIQDVAIIEQGQYSALYGRTAWFLNGALFLCDEARRERIRRQHKVLLEQFNCILLNNANTAERGAELIGEIVKREI